MKLKVPNRPLIGNGMISSERDNSIGTVFWFTLPFRRKSKPIP